MTLSVVKNSKLKNWITNFEPNIAPIIQQIMRTTFVWHKIRDFIFKIKFRDRKTKISKHGDKYLQSFYD